MNEIKLSPYFHENCEASGGETQCISEQMYKKKNQIVISAIKKGNRLRSGRGLDGNAISYCVI